MGRSKGDKNIEQRVKNAIVYLKKIKPKYSPKQILHELNLEKNREALHILRGDRLPNERQTFQIIKDNKNEIDSYVASELDSEWNVGLCMQNDIPAAMIPLLIEFEQMKRELSNVLSGIKLTVRQCRWFSYLYQSATASELLIKQFEAQKLKGYIAMLAEMYAIREQLCESLEQPIETSDLDQFFQNPDDFDLVKIWMQTVDAEEFEKHQKALADFEPISGNELAEKLDMELPIAQVNIFNKWLYNDLLKRVEPHKAGKIEKKLLEQHPELSPMITAWVEYREECLNHHFEKEKKANDTKI